jgi:taurine transport system permease protein
VELAKNMQVGAEEYRGLARIYLSTAAAVMRVPWLWTLMVTAAPFVLLIAVWATVAAAKVYSDVLFPSPSVIVKTAWEITVDGLLWTDIKASMWNLGLGFIVGAGIAIPLGLTMGLVRSVARFFEPVITFFQAIPGLAWIPLAILWFGANEASVIFIIFTSVFFPVLYSMLAGVRGTPAPLIDAARTMGAKTFTIIGHVIIPSSLPSLMTGLRLAFGYGFRSLVAGEMVVGTSGLGFMIFDARSYMRSDLVMVGMIVIGVIGLSIDRTLLKSLERRTIERWGLTR